MNMDDLVRRMDVIERLEINRPKVDKDSDRQRARLSQWQADREAVLSVAAQPDDAALHESCTDCPLYDHDRHSCPRFNKVIPTAILDAQPEIIRCKDCKQFRRWVDTDICFCDITESEMSDNDYCSRAERREV